MKHTVDNVTATDARRVILIGRVIRAFRWSAPVLIITLTPIALLSGTIGNTAALVLRSVFTSWTGPVAMILSIVAFSALGTMIIRAGERSPQPSEHDRPPPLSD